MPEDQKIAAYNRMVRAEVVILSNLKKSEHIVKLHEAIKDGAGTVQLVMDFAQNGSLGELIQSTPWRRSSTPEKEAIARLIMRQLLLAIGSLHAAGFFHRDIKAENILVKGDVLSGSLSSFRIFLADFGVSCHQTDIC